MRIEVIKTHEAFANLKEDWEAVYAADPDAQFFLSWTWLSIWLKNVQNWAVLVARPDTSSPALGFFPIRLRVERTPAGEPIKEVVMAGNGFADYTGFICRPECDDDVIPAFAAYLKKIHWDHFHFENIRLSPKRIRRFLSIFSNDSFHHRSIKVSNRDSNIDNYVCPYVSLEDTWDRYLSENLKANTRHNVRRYLGRVEKSHDLVIREANKSTVDEDIDILLHFWSLKWGRKKGKNLDRLQRGNRNILQLCFDEGCLFLPVLWNGRTPVGAVASFLDREKKALRVYMQGRDENFNSPPPGFVLHAYGIRWAINNGFKTYDFMRGNEPYKYLFKPEEWHIWYIVISAKSAPPLSVYTSPAHAMAATHDHQPA